MSVSLSALTVIREADQSFLVLSSILQDAKQERLEARAEARAARGKGDGESVVCRSPSQHSVRSDELFVGQEKERANTRERMSIGSEMGIEPLANQKPRANGKIARKVSFTALSCSSISETGCR